jgi:hypothetical protein
MYKTVIRLLFCMCVKLRSFTWGEECLVEDVWEQSDVESIWA